MCKGFTIPAVLNPLSNPSPHWGLYGWKLRNICQKKMIVSIFALSLFCLWLPVCTRIEYLRVDLQGGTNQSHSCLYSLIHAALSGKAEQLKQLKSFIRCTNPPTFWQHHNTHYTYQGENVSMMTCLLCTTDFFQNFYSEFLGFSNIIDSLIFIL